MQNVLLPKIAIQRDGLLLDRGSHSWFAQFCPVFCAMNVARPQLRRETVAVRPVAWRYFLAINLERPEGHSHDGYQSDLGGHT